MPDMSAAPSPALARRDRSVQARRKAREAGADREQQIVDLLNRGVSVAEIASQSGVSIQHMRKLVREILAERAPQPPAEFLALQVSRLSEALLLSYSAMHNSVTGTNFEAVDRVVKIVRELDRYHGFAAVPRPREEREPLRLAPPAESPIAIGAPVAETIQIGAASDRKGSIRNRKWQEPHSLCRRRGIGCGRSARSPVGRGPAHRQSQRKRQEKRCQ